MSNVTLTHEEGLMVSVYDSYGEKQLLAALYSLISTVGVIGNGAVVLAPVLSRKPRSPTSFFVINLAVADFLTCLSLPIMILAVLSKNKEELLIPPFLCALQGFLFVVCIGCSMNSVVAIAIYRAVIIRRTNPSRLIRLFNRRGLAIAIATNWLFPLASSLLPIVSRAGSYDYDIKMSTCSFSPSAHGSETFSMIAFPLYLVQLVLIFASSALIVFSVRKHMMRINPLPQQLVATVGVDMRLTALPPNAHRESYPRHPPPHHRPRRDPRLSLEVTISVFLVVFFFMVCSTPYLVAIAVLRGNVQKCLPFLAVLLITNTCINPVIYTARHPDFKPVCRCIMQCRLSEIPMKTTFLKKLVRCREG